MHRGTFKVFIEEDNISKFIKISNSSSLSIITYENVIDKGCRLNYNIKVDAINTLMTFSEICHIERPQNDPTEEYIEVQIPLEFLGVYNKVRKNHFKLSKCI